MNRYSFSNWEEQGTHFCSISCGDIVGVAYVFATSHCYWTTKSTVLQEF